MKKWFATLKEARAYLKTIDAYTAIDYRVFRSLTRKAKSYFVGTYLDWLEY